MFSSDSEPTQLTKLFFFAMDASGVLNMCCLIKARRLDANVQWTRKLGGSARKRKGCCGGHVALHLVIPLDTGYSWSPGFDPVTSHDLTQNTM